MIRKLSHTEAQTLLEKGRYALSCHHRAAHIAFSVVPIRLLRWPVHTLDRERYQRAQDLVARYQRACIKPFEAAIIDGKLLPPVFVASCQGSYVILEGAHRAAAAREAGAARLHAWRVSLPDSYPPFPFFYVTYDQLQRRPRMRDWRRRFRWREEIPFVDFTSVTRQLQGDCS